MDTNVMKVRTKAFALSAIKAVRTLPRTVDASVIAKQLVRCATSVGANYRSACLARSKADFTAKLCIVAEEADEALYWMELLVESGTCPKEKLSGQMQEARELTSILLASIKTARMGRQ